MTSKELRELPWKWQSHLAMEDEHATCYAARIGFEMIGKCVHTIKKDDYTFGRSYTHYMWRRKVYKTGKKLLDVINNEKISRPK